MSTVQPLNNKRNHYNPSLSLSPSGHVNLDPDVNRQDRKMKSDDDLKSIVQQLALTTLQPKKNFEFITKGDLPGIKLTIPQLYSLEHQDVKQWIDDVKQVFFLCEVTDEKQTAYINLLLSDDISRMIKTQSKDPKVWFNKLITETYTKNRFDKILKEVEKMHVNNYESPKEYLRHFNQKKKETDLCMKKENRLTDREKKIFS
ncbi:hypothetical protein M153_3070004051 [Pseudoloma neurophilia]|uniref:Uncharacterized protein n=1 Tax=Pseudoloma neurophilia TaxID=146866 RepID=A0A0R0M5B0_9MICR|nr:hypothetical protein M153_3070004051 [Pseudoloma neurophilia]